eukprot:TRINITY_DN11079_c0_g2_i2.p2 TRINITY_DN11079_c0_g2~~TRINITY_DN11079_c0_g2_i2.p2  ORF type:complete len:125 (+),score=39.97 TRINITY_DN11079_c0_g2_i2:133-507(+)
MAQTMTFNVVYPQGVAWRAQPNYDARITNTPGPACGTLVQGYVVQGDVQYVCVSTPNGQLFVPISAPNGQQLLQGSNQMQQQLSADVYRVQSQYHAGGNMSAKEMKKMQKKQGKGGKMKDKKKK